MKNTSQKSLFAVLMISLVMISMTSAQDVRLYCPDERTPENSYNQYGSDPTDQTLTTAGSTETATLLKSYDFHDEYKYSLAVISSSPTDEPKILRLFVVSADGLARTTEVDFNAMMGFVKIHDYFVYDVGNYAQNPVSLGIKVQMQVAGVVTDQLWVGLIVVENCTISAMSDYTRSNFGELTYTEQSLSVVYQFLHTDMIHFTLAYTFMRKGSENKIVVFDHASGFSAVTVISLVDQSGNPVSTFPKLSFLRQFHVYDETNDVFYGTNSGLRVQPGSTTMDSFSEKLAVIDTQELNYLAISVDRTTNEFMVNIFRNEQAGPNMDSINEVTADKYPFTNLVDNLLFSYRNMYEAHTSFVAYDNTRLRYFVLDPMLNFYNIFNMNSTSSVVMALGSDVMDFSPNKYTLYALKAARVIQIDLDVDDTTELTVTSINNGFNQGYFYAENAAAFDITRDLELTSSAQSYVSSPPELFVIFEIQCMCITSKPNIQCFSSSHRCLVVAMNTNNDCSEYPVTGQQQNS